MFNIIKANYHYTPLQSNDEVLPQIWNPQDCDTSALIFPLFCSKQEQSWSQPWSANDDNNLSLHEDTFNIRFSLWGSTCISADRNKNLPFIYIQCLKDVRVMHLVQWEVPELGLKFSEIIKGMFQEESGTRGNITSLVLNIEYKQDSKHWCVIWK